MDNSSDFTDPNNILSDPMTAAVADGAANTGDGSATFDDGTTTGTLADGSTAQTATAAPASTGFFSSLFNAVAPSVATLAGAAAQKAVGTVATQQKTALTPNAAATAPTGTIGGLSVNVIIGGVIAILVAVLVLPRLFKK